MSNEAFFYVDGVPTQGVWIDLELLPKTHAEEEILASLAVVGYVERNEEGKPVYDGDLLVADVEGALATVCHSSSTDCFDLELFFRLYDSDLDEDVIADYAAIYGTDDLDLNRIEEAYVGQYRSDADFAAEFVESMGYLDSNSFVSNYIDYEKVGRDLMMDYSEHGGSYFRDC